MEGPYINLILSSLFCQEEDASGIYFTNYLAQYFEN